ncbi:TPA: hypothetical protein N0F65_004956, partial [Lagenidium giganteum]
MVREHCHPYFLLIVWVVLELTDFFVCAAPIWRAYLVERTESVAGGVGRHGSDRPKSRKRAKPSSGIGAVEAMAAQRERSHEHSVERPVAELAPEASMTQRKIRAYWEQLEATERQQVLFIDEPDLVKQLYKLNLSLLCVGLMQRHFKVQAGSGGASGNGAAAATASTSMGVQESNGVAKEKNGAKNKSIAVANDKALDLAGEKSYELLEAMEFMDIGTGILTVKSELIEQSSRLFSLVGDVLWGFLSSVYVLSEKQFYDLFVTESDVINTWEDYQRLIAMLVEQVCPSPTMPLCCSTLILKSYVNYLEKQATDQMEKLLLEVSLEDTAKHTQVTDEAKKSTKPKKKKKPKKKVVERCSTVRDSGDQEEPECEDATSPPSNLPSPKTSARSPVLNPLAPVFEPQGVPAQLFVPTSVSPAPRKRKWDQFVLQLTVDMDLEPSSNCARIDYEDPPEHFSEEDHDLHWQLENIYGSTASVLGWDVIRQCDVPPPGMFWDDETFWRTGPRDVVRCFTSDYGAPAFVSDPSMAPPMNMPMSRYYYTPPPPL